MENLNLRAYRQNVTTVSEDVPRHLLTAVHAVTTAVAQARHNRLEAEQSERDVIGLAFLTMRQLGFSDHYIARELGHPRAELRTYAKAVRQLPPYTQGAATPAARSQPELLWHAARYAASMWIESETITSSRDVIIANNIDDIEYPLPVTTLDTDGAEFVHQRTGEKLIIYSPQRWKGTPTVIDGRPTSWDHQGRYRIEFISAAGERGALAPSLLGLTPEDTQFDTSHPRRRDDHDLTFARIVTALRRAHAILPPYSAAAAEAFTLR